MTTSAIEELDERIRYAQREFIHQVQPVLDEMVKLKNLYTTYVAIVPAPGVYEGVQILEQWTDMKALDAYHALEKVVGVLKRAIEKDYNLLGLNPPHHEAT